MPSPTSSTVPTSSTRRSTSKDSICCRMIELISSVLICIVLSPFVGCDEASPHVRQSPADRPVEDEVAEVDPDAADGLRIDQLVENDGLPGPLLQHVAQRRGEIGVQLAGRDHGGPYPPLVVVPVVVELLDDVVEEQLPPFLDQNMEQPEDRPAHLALERHVEDPPLVGAAEQRQVEKRPELRIEPAESLLDRVQVVRDAAQGLLLKGEIEERLGVDAGRCLVATHSLSATSSTTSRASRR